MTLQEPVCVAIITAPQGVKGAVRLRLFIEDLKRYEGQPFFFGTHLESSLLLLRTQIIPASPPRIIGYFQGITTRNQAESLRGTELYISRENFPTLAEDEFYLSELIGLVVKSVEGTAIGKVTNIYNYGAGDILEIKHDDSHEKTLYGFTKLNFPVCNIAEGYLILDPPTEF